MICPKSSDSLAQPKTDVPLPLIIRDEPAPTGLPGANTPLDWGITGKTLPTESITYSVSVNTPTVYGRPGDTKPFGGAMPSKFNVSARDCVPSNVPNANAVANAPPHKFRTVMMSLAKLPPSPNWRSQVAVTSSKWMMSTTN